VVLGELSRNGRLIRIRNSLLLMQISRFQLYFSKWSVYIKRRFNSQSRWGIT